MNFPHSPRRIGAAAVHRRIRACSRCKAYPIIPRSPYCVSFRAAASCAALIVCSAAISAAAAGGAGAGWQPQTYRTIRAIYGVRVTHHFGHTDKSCLVADVNLNGGTADRREGEVYVDLRFHPPQNVLAPVNLSGKTIHVWVFAPAGLAGPAKNPNGIRIFVKDSGWRSEYGTWVHVTPGRWVRLTLTPSTTTPPHGYRSPGFDPQKIIALGVSVAAGAHSTAHYRGGLEIDDVSWDGQTRYGFGK